MITLIVNFLTKVSQYIAGHEADIPFFQNHITLILYGWLGYNLWCLNRAKKEFDTDGDGYLSWKEFIFYLKVQLIPIIFSIWTLPVGYFYAENIWFVIMDLLNKDYGFFDGVYVIMGSLSALLQWGIKKITK